MSLKSGIWNVLLRTQSCPIRLTFQAVKYEYMYPYVMCVSFHCKCLGMRQNMKLDPEPRWSASKKLRTRQQQCTDPEIDTWRNGRYWGKDWHVKNGSLLSQIVTGRNGRHSTICTWRNGLHSARDWHVEKMVVTEQEIGIWRNGQHSSRDWHVENWLTLFQRLARGEMVNTLPEVGTWRNG